MEEGGRSGKVTYEGQEQRNEIMVGDRKLKWMSG